MQYNLPDIILTLIFLTLTYFIASYISRLKKEKAPEYNYYTRGLMAKVFGGIAVCLVYSFYYQGGDTINYYKDSVALGKLLFENSGAYFSILIGNLSLENYSAFNHQTGYPGYFTDSQAFAVVRFVSPFTLIGFRSFLPVTILVAAFNYSGIWRLYKLFIEKFPGMNYKLAIAILFMPSLIFWGSGILKDSFTISASGWFIYSYYNLMMKRRKPFLYILTLIISSYVLISIKPYIFFSILIAIAVWNTAELVNKIKGTFLRTILSPLLVLVVWSVGSGLVMYLGSLIGGAYSNVDTLIEKAIVTQDDLKRDYYFGNSFDIGTIEPTIQGILSKYPQAVTAGLFRPFLWESKNPVMFLAGLENMFILIFVIFVLLKVRAKIISITFNESLLLSSLVFSLTFAFSIGLSTSNFGSLVRYKIPLIPFFVSYLFVVYEINRKSKISSD